MGIGHVQALQTQYRQEHAPAVKFGLVGQGPGFGFYCRLGLLLALPTTPGADGNGFFLLLWLVGGSSLFTFLLTALSLPVTLLLARTSFGFIGTECLVVDRYFFANRS